MSFKLTVVLFAIALAFSEAAKLPNYFSQCKKNDPKVGECIVKSAKNGFSTFIKGDPAHHIQILNPLKVPTMFIEVGNNLRINLSDIVITGIEQMDVVDADVDFDKQKFDFVLRFPTQINILSEYDVGGRILILPINGRGPMNVTFVKPFVNYHFDYDLKERGDRLYIAPKNTSFHYNCERAYFHLDNLFNGDKSLGENMNQFLYENWEPVNGEIGEKVGDAMGEVFSAILTNFFGKVPFDELFGSDILIKRQAQT